MNDKELLKAIVMAESQDERMALAEQLTELMGTTSDINPEELTAKITELQTALDETVEKLKASDQKYIDRFFASDEQKKTEEPKKEEKAISTDDIVEEMGGKK